MSGAFDKTVRGQRELHSKLADVRRDRARDASADVIIEEPRRLIIRGDDGDFYAVGVISGALSLTNLGSEAP